jgi:hypothetical protein
MGRLIFFQVIFIYASTVLSQINQPKQLTDFGFDSRNPSFIEYSLNEPTYLFPSEIFFEAHTATSINIYTMSYNVESDSFLQPIPITEGNYKNKNLTGTITFDSVPYKLILWETNVNGNWDIAYSKNYGGGFTPPQLLVCTEEDETSPSIVLDHFNYFFEELNILFVQNDSILVYTKTDTSVLTYIIFQANDSTKYSAPTGITYEGELYAVAVEGVNDNTLRLVYKTRHFDSTNWSEKYVAFEGDSVQNPKFVDAYYPYSPNVYLNFDIIKNGKKRSVLLSPNNFGDSNPPLIYVVEDSTVESSEFDSFSYYIVTDQVGFQSVYPYAYRINYLDSTFIIAGSENYWYEYNILTAVQSAEVAIGPLSFKEFGIVSYTIWEDSNNSQINLFGLKRYDILSDVNDETLIVTEFKLEQNYPNPFNPSTKIKFTIPSVETTRRVVFTTLKVYDILGNEIATLVNEEKPAGQYEVEFNTGSHSGEGRNLPAGKQGLVSGIYFYQLKSGSFVETKKMLLIK